MAERVFIKVVGFSDEERHALNTVFRLSEQCRTMYQLWTPEAPQAPRLALLDAQSHEARVEAELPLPGDMRRLWVGNDPPAGIWRSFPRPLAWPEVIEALDMLFGGDDGLDVDLGLDLDLDLDLGGGAPEAMSQKQALIVSPEREERLYLRARLSLAKLTLADEADTGAQALQLARDKQYDVALVACEMADMNAWELLRQLREGRRPIPRVAMTTAGRSLAERVRAWLAGADAMLEKPPDPARLDAWLSRV